MFYYVYSIYQILTFFRLKTDTNVHLFNWIVSKLLRLSYVLGNSFFFFFPPRNRKYRVFRRTQSVNVSKLYVRFRVPLLRPLVLTYDYYTTKTWCCSLWVWILRIKKYVPTFVWLRYKRNYPLLIEQYDLSFCFAFSRKTRFYFVTESSDK